MMRYLRPFWGMALTLMLGVMLLATIYFTLFDLQWIAFLAGVLFAAIAATASQASKARWLVARRTKQLQRARNALAEESARRERAVEAQQLAEARLQLINDELPVMIAFIDRDERCRYHSRAFGLWNKHNGNAINDQPLRDLVGNEIYHELKSHIADVLAGKEIRFEVEWRQPDGGIASCSVALLPFPPGAERPAGFYLLVARNAGAAIRMAVAAPSVESMDDAMIGSRESGETFYLQSMTEQLIGGQDPRAHLVQALEEDHFILFAQNIQPLSPSANQGKFLEILLRLQEEEDYMLPPGGFV
jgi:PAS domain-containing protein